MRIATLTASVFALTAPVVSQEIVTAKQTTPKRGIATRHPGDRGIAGDKRVILHEDFEAKDWAKSWPEIKGRGKQTVVIDDKADVHGGKRALRITATRDRDTGGHLFRSLGRGRDRLHLRFYVKFEKAHGHVHHFVHLCGYHPPTRWPQGGAGLRPDGGKRFSTGIEPTGNWGRFQPPGVWGFYSYWCEMKKSRDGKFWGNAVRPKPEQKITRDTWICVEIMLQCNDPKQRDGAQAIWIDGKPAGQWTGYRWRTTDDFGVNGVWILYYITPNAARQNKVKKPRTSNTVWFDDIVVATDYIGPRVAGKPKR